MTKFFALCDCNSFYVSYERVFHPAFKNKPVVVLSNNDGFAISWSHEAKDVGIGMGEPWFMKQSRKSKRYTTRRDELLEIKI